MAILMVASPAPAPNQDLGHLAPFEQVSPTEIYTNELASTVSAMVSLVSDSISWLY